MEKLTYKYREIGPKYYEVLLNGITVGAVSHTDMDAQMDEVLSSQGYGSRREYVDAHYAGMNDINEGGR